MWIRRSTGRLCAELTPPSGPDWWFYPLDQVSRMQKSFVLDPPDKEATVVGSFTMREYHEICTRNLAQYRNISFPISGYRATKLGAVISFSSTPLTGEHILALEDPVEIAFLPNVMASTRMVYIGHWQTSEEVVGVVMEDRWTR